MHCKNIMQIRVMSHKDSINLCAGAVFSSLPSWPVFWASLTGKPEPEIKLNFKFGKTVIKPNLFPFGGCRLLRRHGGPLFPGPA